MMMHLRALYLSVLICAAVSVAACLLSTPLSVSQFAARRPEVAPEKPTIPPSDNKWRLYRAGLERHLLRLMPHAAAGFLAGALLRIAQALPGRPHRDRGEFSEISPRAARRSRVQTLPAAASEVERELFERVAGCADLPADPLSPGSGALLDCVRREWEAAARAFGAGTLESQLAALRHAGKLLAYKRDPTSEGGYAVEADPRPLAVYMLRQFDSFHEMSPEMRRELVQALYAMQSGWAPVDLPPRTRRALCRLAKSAGEGEST